MTTINKAVLNGKTFTTGQMDELKGMGLFIIPNAAAAWERNHQGITYSVVVYADGTMERNVRDYSGIRRNVSAVGFDVEGEKVHAMINEWLNAEV